MKQYERNLWVLSLAIFLASISWFQIMPFLPLFLEEMGVKENILQWSGLIFAIQSMASIVALPYWGKLGDRYGRKAMTLRAGFCLAGIYFGMSVCRTPYELAFLRFLNGALTGFIPGAMALIATGTPQKEGPRAVAIAQSASAAGQIVGPGIGGFMASLFGYRGSMSVSGSAVLFSTLLVLVMVREGPREVSEEKTSILDDFRLMLQSPVLASVMLVVLVNSFFMSAVNPVLALHLREIGRGAPAWLAGCIFSLPATAFVLFAQRWTGYGDRAGYDRAILTGLAGATLCGISLSLVRGIWVFALFFFALGVCVASIAPSAGAIICLRVPEHFRGRAYGMQQSAVMVGALLAPITATQVAARLGIPAVFAINALLYLAGIAGFRALVRRW
ncbi:MAG TPA: MFS transporter [Armatimonadota bacterium]|jgi:DHA1 family multidrug resistance protein-like MFS transporter|nr:MFS transporter [Armatimonadota bacterium]HOM80784.1 MFS transporter [Armatimonadota bacterium]HPO71865.1 MFS transporter [Armatimonadota bacterium]